MGGGQNEIAIETLKSAAKKGEWVCLKNLHLVTPWLSVLEKEFKMLQPDPKFRLWLTSEPHLKFPSILLQTSLKITYETPPGVRNNLNRTFQYVCPADVKHSSPVQTQMLFILSWFHALLQERRTYIPQGWVKYYEFSYGDLMAGEKIIDTICNEIKGGAIPWQKVYGILENAIYGGRIDNEFDMRVLRTYMQGIFGEHTISGKQPLSGLIQVPKSGNVQEFYNTIQKVPEIDNPDIFGLPVNIDRSVQRFNSNQVILGLKGLAAAGAKELRFDKEKWTEQLGPICQLWGSIYKADTFRQLKITQQDFTTKDPVD
jgi:dynein heavy chain 2